MCSEPLSAAPRGLSSSLMDPKTAMHRKNCKKVPRKVGMGLKGFPLLAYSSLLSQNEVVFLKERNQEDLRLLPGGGSSWLKACIELGVVHPGLLPALPDRSPSRGRHPAPPLAGMPTPPAAEPNPSFLGPMFSLPFIPHCPRLRPLAPL